MPSEEQQVPRCGVVVQKEGQASQPCPNDAAYLYQIADPDDHTRIMSVLLLCERHARKFDDGKSLLMQDEEGNLEIVGTGTPPPPDDTIEAHSAAS